MHKIAFLNIYAFLILLTTVGVFYKSVKLWNTKYSDKKFLERLLYNFSEVQSLLNQYAKNPTGSGSYLDMFLMSNNLMTNKIKDKKII